VSASVSQAEFGRIRDAWQLATSAHAGQTRQSGEPYSTHPLAVAEILFDALEPDADALCAALLHDVVEDSDTSLVFIREQFGAPVAAIVDGVSKLARVGASTSNDDTLRKLVAAGGSDWRVFAVKLCDRLHNMRTLGAVNAAKRRRVARETHAVFFPLARYVGFQRIAIELEALSLRWLYPWRWGVLERWSLYRARIDVRRLRPFLGDFPELLESVCSAQRSGVDPSVMVRCYAQLVNDRASRAVFSVPTVHVRVGSIRDAHADIAALHSQFVYVPGSFACDASEGSASTKVLLGARGPVAEFVFSFPRIARGSWVRSVGETANSDEFRAVADASNHPGEFTRVLRDLVVEKSISVFSPKGQRLSLPRGASALDFAFAIHTELGLRATAVRVNGVLRGRDAPLSSGDIVEVIVGDDIVARPEWESVLRSPRSRAKLRQWVRESARRDAAALGKRLLEDAARGLGADANGGDAISLAPLFGASSSEELYRLIGVGELSAFAVASGNPHTGAGKVLAATSAHDGFSRLVVDGSVQFGIQYCPHCQPVHGDAVAAQAVMSGVMIHRIECPKKADGRLAGGSFIVEWAQQMRLALPTTVVVRSNDRRGLLADCARVISDVGMNVVAVKTKSSDASSKAVAVLEFTVLVRLRSKLERCIAALRGVANVFYVGRADL
jgi:guanosine-3',5'-bis(diphosphate) 3'-pyrophosphohydrolase